MFGQAQFSLSKKFDTLQYAPVREGIRRLIGLSLLPVRLVLPAYQRLLPYPFVQSARIDQLMQQFWPYFERTWMNPATLELWNRYSSGGSRSNNAV